MSETNKNSNDSNDCNDSCDTCSSYLVMEHPCPFLFMRFFAHAGRMMLGVIFFLFGVNGLSPFIPHQIPLSSGGSLLMTALSHSPYLLKFISLVEIMGGFMLLMNFMTPLALLILFPITLNIFLFHLFLEPQMGFKRSVFMLLTSIYLAIVYRNAYAPLFKLKHILGR